jgi:hypothetical protein
MYAVKKNAQIFFFADTLMRRAGLISRLATLGLCCGLAACGPQSDAIPADAAASGKTLGLVLSSFDYLFYSTEDGKEECPDGPVHSSKDNWHVQFPTRAAREAHFNRCGGIDNRGPDCENVLVAPESTTDPLPYRSVQGSKSYGANLDGTPDGRETATTCAHEKFVHPDGTQGIDNQYYRLMGCQKSFQRTNLFGPDVAKDTAARFIALSRTLRTVLQIQEIDDERNDEQVKVVIYRGKDRLAVDAQNRAIPWQSQRIDTNTRPQHLRGRIVDGELITEPADVTWHAVSFHGHAQRPILIRGAQFRLRLNEAGAEGVRTGYVDVASWWRVRRATVLAGSFAGDSPPSLYAALHRLADGYKDPQTGACTALSSAMKLEFVRAYVRHPNEGIE